MREPSGEPSYFITIVEDVDEREREVLRHLALGRTNKEIAREPYVSGRTAKFPVRNIIEKLGVEDREQAADCASDSGLVNRNHTPRTGAQGS